MGRNAAYNLPKSQTRKWKGNIRQVLISQLWLSIANDMIDLGTACYDVFAMLRPFGELVSQSCFFFFGVLFILLLIFRKQRQHLTVACGCSDHKTKRLKD